MNNLGDESPTIALRLATDSDRVELARLAELDSASLLDGPALVAVVDGRLVAATSLAGGEVIADPFVASADARALLETRAHQLAGTRRRPWARLLTRMTTRRRRARVVETLSYR
jgi:hypothetical protein